MKKILDAIKRAFSAAARFLSSSEFKLAEQRAMMIVMGIAELTRNKTIGEAIEAYNAYGIPVTSALADGKLSDEEIKASLGFLAAKVLKRMFPAMSTTQANILINAAYEQFKSNKGGVQ